MCDQQSDILDLRKVNNVSNPLLFFVPTMNKSAYELHFGNHFYT